MWNRTVFGVGICLINEVTDDAVQLVNLSHSFLFQFVEHLHAFLWNILGSDDAFV